MRSVRRPCGWHVLDTPSNKLMSESGNFLCMTPIMAGAPRKQETVLMRLTVSAKLHNYLSFLSRTTTMGASENDVALFLLTRQLEDMRQSENYGFDLSNGTE